MERIKKDRLFDEYQGWVQVEWFTEVCDGVVDGNALGNASVGDLVGEDIVGLLDSDVTQEEARYVDAERHPRAQS
jgi:hypothetical protein